MFESNEKLEKLIGQMATMIELQMSLLKKLEQQNTSLSALTKFVRDNSGASPACGAV
ncbi:hypothetical protein SBA1_100072 [Candidatus Sulfotelmatobacter kueseliae]|uniref:Uncharacterized protein n=1 Tax=Candidatus Sulfotelmatobacter kueseliae TaxID=2042962 RepID=A0A2U3JW20_9BACT|nr:hypothetical protein SBA1_100072 [Candidatus Sulfotelmatobacter kueseliae]